MGVDGLNCIAYFFLSEINEWACVSSGFRWWYLPGALLEHSCYVLHISVHLWFSRHRCPLGPSPRSHPHRPHPHSLPAEMSNCVSDDQCCWKNCLYLKAPMFLKWVIDYHRSTILTLRQCRLSHLHRLQRNCEISFQSSCFILSSDVLLYSNVIYAAAKLAFKKEF